MGDLIDITPFLRPLVGPVAVAPRRGPKPEYASATTSHTRTRQWRQRKMEDRKRFVAILDMETDPFDNVARAEIRPFVACLYSDEFDPIIIWEENYDCFCNRVCEAIVALPNAFTIYAHNGGRFDFLFLVHKLRGAVKFKGRGIMSARIGAHELRDSFHIIPEKLAAFQKDAFDYSRMKKCNRQQWRKEIIEYLISDCRYLLDIVKKFLDQFGFKLSIGQAAMHELKKHYTVKRFSRNWDGYVREYFFGGRVECLAGRGHFITEEGQGNWKLYDVNGMYPFVMANYRHPIGGFQDYEIRECIGPDTIFLKLECDNHGGLVRRNENNETVAAHGFGEFKTTIWEYNVAKKYGLISNERIILALDCAERTTFDKFVLPLYENRLLTKQALSELKSIGQKGSAAWIETNKDDIFYKLLMNNAYGKFAQNPRKFTDHYLTDPECAPPDDWWHSVGEMLTDLEFGPDAAGVGLGAPLHGWKNYVATQLQSNEHLRHEFQWVLFPAFEDNRYWIWQKPAPSFRFNNVGVAASITGAARSVLLEAIQHAASPIYCDTDSIMARSLSGVDLDKTALGAWDLEQEYSEVLIAGKKLYACKVAGLPDGHSDKIKIRSKGTQGLTWQSMQRIVAGGIEEIYNNAPTLTKFSSQSYIKRRIRATVPVAKKG